MIMMNYIDPRVLNVKTYLNESKYQIEFSGFCGLYLKCFRIRAATYKNWTWIRPFVYSYVFRNYNLWLSNSPGLFGCFLFDVAGLLVIMLTVIGNGRNSASHCQVCDELNSRATNAFSYQDKVAIETNQYSGSSESGRIDFSKI